MKINFIAFLILAAHCYCNGQNWSLINVNETYNFSSIDSIFITNVIYADSITINSQGDTVFHLNRILAPCEFCVGAFNPKYIVEQEQFLRKNVTKKQNGITEFQGSSSFFIHSLAELNESWNFDDFGTTASLTLQDTITIFNQLDSMKRIDLSDGRSISISKNFGILNFAAENDFYYTLKGLEERNIGTLLPKFEDYFNFDLGDIFEFKIEGHSGAYPNYMDEPQSNIVRAEILAMDSSLDKFEYYIKYWSTADKQQMPIFKNWTISRTSGSSLYSISDFGLLECSPMKYSGNCVELQTVRCDSFHGLQSKKTVTGLYIYDDTTHIACWPPYIDFRDQNTFVEGLGVVHSVRLSLNGSTNGSIDRAQIDLIAAKKKNGFEFGTLTPDSDFYNTENIFYVYPSPAKESFFVMPVSEDPISWTFQLMDIQGRIIDIPFQTSIGNKTVFDISKVSAGLYFFKIIFENKSELHKLIISKD